MTNEELIQDMKDHIARGEYEGYALTNEECKQIIQALEQQRWILVSERLPEKQDCYLVTTKWKGSYSGDVYIETNMAVYREKPKEWDCVDVIAWMPLPQPYKECDKE